MTRYTSNHTHAEHEQQSHIWYIINALTTFRIAKFSSQFSLLCVKVADDMERENCRKMENYESNNLIVIAGVCVVECWRNSGGVTKTARREETVEMEFSLVFFAFDISHNNFPFFYVPITLFFRLACVHLIRFRRPTYLCGPMNYDCIIAKKKFGRWQSFCEQITTLSRTSGKNSLLPTFF